MFAPVNLHRRPFTGLPETDKELVLFEARPQCARAVPSCNISTFGGKIMPSLAVLFAVCSATMPYYRRDVNVMQGESGAARDAIFVACVGCIYFATTSNEVD